MKRYRPRKAFAVYIKGAARLFHPEHVDKKDGLPGYPSLPKGLSKQQKASFVEFDYPAPVEAATAAPGEVRTTKRAPTAKKAPAKKT